MIGRIRYSQVYLGLFLLLTLAVAAAMYAVAPPLEATIYTVFWGGVYGAGLYACRRFGEENELQFEQFGNAGAALALVLCLGGIVLSGIETGLILLLLTLQAGRNLSLATRRDLNFSCLVSLILLLYGAGKAMSGYFLAFIALYALAAIFTFMADHIDARLSHAHGGDRALLTRRMNLPVKGIGVAFLTLALAFAIYLIVPRPASPRVQAFPASSSWNYDNREWEAEAKTPRREGEGDDGNSRGGGNSRPSAGALAQASVGNSDQYGGFSETLGITDSDICTLRPDAVVLYLQADSPLYLRGKVFDSFDGRRWEGSGAGTQKYYSREGKFSFGGKPGTADTRQVVTVRQDLPPLIFAAYQPLLVSFPGNAIEADGALALRAPDRLRKGTVYSVASHLEAVDGHPCSGAALAADEGRPADGRYLTRYPELSHRLRALAREVTKGATSDLARARAVESYLRDNFAYTLDTVGVKWSGNPVEQFLFDLKAGHCELFASSMVVMLCTLDIPARLVTGFYVGSKRYNPVTGYYEVRASDGHAWVEAYLEPHGWVTFEPTSSYELPRPSPRLFVVDGLVRYLGESTEDLLRRHPDSLWVKFVMKVWQIMMAILAALTLILAAMVRSCLTLWIWFLREGWLVLLLVVAGSGGGWCLWRALEPVWRLARLRRAQKGDPQRFLRLCYGEMERHFCRERLPRPLHVTPLEYQELLAGRFPAIASPVATITRLFQQAAYGSVPVSVAQAAEALSAFAAVQRYDPDCVGKKN